MSDWTPKEIDKLFQDGSEKYEFEYNEAAWGKMEVLLDDQERKKKHLLWWLLGGLLGVLLIGSIYFLKDEKQEAITTAQEVIKTGQKEQLSTSIKDAHTTLKKDKPNSKETEITPENVKQPIKIQSNRVESPLSKTTQTIEKYGITTNTENLTATTHVNLKRVLPTAKRLVTEATTLGQQKEPILPVNTQLPVTEESLEKENRSTLVSKNRKTNFTLDALPTLPSTIELIAEPILLDAALLKTEQPITTVIKPSNDNHFVVGLILAREQSFVGEGLCAPKWKAGLSLEYRFGGKHSLRLEGSYSQKEYLASATKYKAPEGFWFKAIAPQSAQGFCNIVEMSITESYFFKGHAKRGFYVNAGLSSYFMLRERYEYNYSSTEDGLRRGWGTENENQHWFGIGEVSLGYNLPFSDNSSLQIAPYAQIPLTGIGHGQVKFFTTGIQLRYNFHLR